MRPGSHLLAHPGKRCHFWAEFCFQRPAEKNNGSSVRFWEGDFVRVLTSPETFEQCVKVFQNIPVQKSDISLVAEEEKEISDVQNAQKIMKLIDLLEDDDDVDEVFTNCTFSDEAIEAL